MPLEKTQPRLDALQLANEARLYVDPASDEYWTKDEFSDELVATHPPVANAAEELRADDPPALEPGTVTDPIELTPIVLTADGAELLSDWSQ